MQTDTMAAQLAPVAEFMALVRQLAEPTRENVEAVAALVVELKYPSIPLKHILSAHIRSAHMNVCIEDSMEVQQAQGRLHRETAVLRQQQREVAAA